MYLHPQKRSMFFYVIANRVLVTAATRHVSACHCEERGGRPATRQSVFLAAVQNKKQHLRRIRSGDEFALSAADFFPPLQGRGLSRRLAPRNDRQKADADLRLQVRPDGENLQPSTRPFLATVLREKRAVPLMVCANHFETAP